MPDGSTCAPSVRLLRMRVCVVLVAMVFGALGLGVSRAAADDAATLQTFTLSDYLEHDWSAELVFFQLNAAAAQAATSPDAVSLVGQDGKPVAFQLAKTVDGPAVALLVDLPANATRSWRLVKGGALASTAPPRVQVGEHEGNLRLSNADFGIDIRKAIDADHGPIAGIRMRSGKWIADSTTRFQSKLISYEAKVIASGPLYGEVLTTARFEGGKIWKLRVRVIGDDPVAVFREQFDLRDGSTWQLQMGTDFDHGLFRCAWYRPDSTPTHAMHLQPLDVGSSPFLLLPWIEWSSGRQASCFNLFRKDPKATYARDADRRMIERIETPDAGQSGSGALGGGSDDALADFSLEEPTAAEDIGRETSKADVIFFAAGEAGKWARPGQWGPNTGVPLFVSGDGRLSMDFQLRQPERVWMLGNSTLNRTLVPDRDLAESEQQAIRHVGTSLNEVNKMTLVWGDAAEAAQQYPRIAFGKADIERLRQELGPPPHSDATDAYLYRQFVDDSPAATERAIARARDTQPARLFLQHLQIYDPVNGEHVRRQDSRVWTHTICRLGFVPDIDDVLGRGVLSEQEFIQLRAKLAFLAYKFGSPHFYDQSRGWRANPNMTTTRYAVVGLLACLLADHPMAPRWYTLGTTEITRQLEEWVGPNGGWLESPHYQSLLGDGIMLLWAAHRAGLSDDIYHPNLLKTVTYLAKISTPPDPRFFNRRHVPAVGNTYRFETTGMSGILAWLHRERHPDIAAELQWAWIQQGKPMWTGIGGASYIGKVMGFMTDRNWTPDSPPDWQSEVFPKSGTLLKGHFPSDRETWFYILHGDFVQHYDNDRGSFSFWGQGQPLCLDWGYAEPYSADMHSMLDTATTHGKPAGFFTSEACDYVHVDLGAWQRQVLLAKDDDPLDANFVFIRDTSAKAGRWYQWLYTDKPVEADKEGRLLMHGMADVNMDIWLADGRGEEVSRLSRKEAKEAVAGTPDAPAPGALAIGGKQGGGDALGLGDGALDLSLDEPDTPSNLVRTRRLDISVATGTGGGSNAMQSMTQHGMSLPVNSEKPVTMVLFPRQRTAPKPTFTELADGRGVHVKSAHGSDYLFLANEPFTFEADGIAFTGTAGAIRVRGDKVTFTLGDKGRIAYRGKTFASDKPAASP